METRAVAKYLRISPIKVRMITGALKGKKAEEAMNMLAFAPKKAARMVHKVLKSAVANASQNKNIDVDSLIIKVVCVDEGPVLKRFIPRAMGRATPILKRTSHVTVILKES
jgi:large subunit ribosomal protein L22